nr:hypothetical protein [Tanacetum cinerariifolium]
MVPLMFVDTYNMVVYLSKFDATTIVKKVNDIVQLRALIDGKKVFVFEAIIIRDLPLDDVDGCLSDKSTAWNKFSCSIASAIICLATSRKFNFSKYIFDNMVRNVDSPSKFLMYPHFLQVVIQVDDMTSHNTRYTSPTLTQKAEEEVEVPIAPAPPSPTSAPSPPPQDQPSTPHASPPHEQPTTISESFMSLLTTLMKIWGKIKAIDADEDITLVDVETNKEAVTMDVEPQERINQKGVNTTSNGNLTGYKMEHFRRMTYDKVRPIFKREYKKVQTLFKLDKDVEEPKKKRVADKTLLQESFKKLKAVEVSDADDVLWKLQRYMHAPLTWKLYTDCRVHHVSSTRGHDIFMLTEKDYPLSNAVIILMLSGKLQVEEDNEMARDLVLKIFMKANKPKSMYKVDAAAEVLNNLLLVVSAVRVNISVVRVNISAVRTILLLLVYIGIFGDAEDDDSGDDMNNLDTYFQEEGIDYNEVFAPFARIKAIRLFLAYASFKDFIVYKMDVKSAFLYGQIEEEVYVCQPLGFEDLNFLDRVYKVKKALYGLYQAPRAWSTRKELCTEFEKIMHKKFKMSFMGELTFFLGLQVKQKEDGIFISQDKYVNKILNKFGFSDVKTASTPTVTKKHLLKDEDGVEVDVHLYRLMIGSLMYLTSSRPDIMFTDLPFDLEAYTDTHYAGASLDRKSTTSGFQFLGCREGCLEWNGKATKDEIDIINIVRIKRKQKTKREKSEQKELREVAYIYNCQLKVNAARHKLPTTIDVNYIFDFLNANPIKYALTMNPTVYTSCIKQFWATAKAKNINGEAQIHAKVDGKKVFGNMKRVGKNFFGKETPLFLTMLVHAQADIDSTMPSAPQHTPIIQPLTPKTQKKLKPRTSKNKDTQETHPSGLGDNVVDKALNAENVPTHSNDPLLSGEDSIQLKELIDLYANLQKRVLDLETIKTNQAMEIDSLKRRERYNDEEMFDTRVLDDEEVLVEKAVTVKEVDVAQDQVSAATNTAKDLTINDITLAKALEALKTSKPKIRGIVVKDKGKGRIVKLEILLKKNAQISLDEELTFKLQAEQEEERIAREKAQRIEEVNLAWGDVLDDEDDVTIDATPLSSKSPTIIDYRIHKEGRKVISKSSRQMVVLRFSTVSTPVSTVSSHDNTTNLNDATVYAFLANQPNGSQLVHEDLEQIHEDDLKEINLKWQLALLSMRAKSLEEFQHPEFKGYGPKDSKSVCVDTLNDIKKDPDAPIIEHCVSDSDEDESKEMVLKSDNV